ncbi:hypothetical protein SRB5_49510 [Streptomyces sp. RB5]|uniref:4'-phosphopantetheinyl transferase domain-containing protein n=1 Tax=Streptomyces smaragdinus TaxID=2585196 RepID=A0A7K0CMR9_9ACTN|nr:hypothetical protein [Streptomyces smaragdinus]
MPDPIRSPLQFGAVTILPTTAVDVRLWLLRLPGDPAATGFGPLGPEERTRATAFRRPDLRARYVAAHTALREILGAETGRAPGDLVMVREPCPGCGELHGRPALEDGPHFSLSHSDDVVLVGVADAPIGVDVEGTATESSIGDVLPRLHPAEQAEIRDAADRSAAFTTVWVRKEAWLKGIGIGLARSLAEDHIGHRGQPPGWSVADVPAIPGYAAAVAVRGALGRLEVADRV